MLSLAAIFIGYFCFYTSNYGGYSYSVRWFVTLIPLLWFFAFPFFVQWSRIKSWAYGTLVAISSVIAFVGAFDPWPPTLTSGQSGFLLNFREICYRLGKLSPQTFSEVLRRAGLSTTIIAASACTLLIFIAGAVVLTIPQSGASNRCNDKERVE